MRFGFYLKTEVKYRMPEFIAGNLDIQAKKWKLFIAIKKVLIPI